MSEETQLTHVASIDAASVTRTMAELKLIRQFVAGEMVPGTDFGSIPGTGEKKVMLLPGAQKVNMLYNCFPRYTITTTELEGGHADIRVDTELINRSSGSVVQTGVGSCSTMESKYRWRQADRVCPECGKATILRSKFPPRDEPEAAPGWYCFAKKGGCGANFLAHDEAITTQHIGRVENPDIYDVRNTVLKIAKKRSLVDASIGLGCLTELFTQDLEESEPEATKQQPAPQPTDADIAEGQRVMQEWKDALDAQPLLHHFNGFLKDVKECSPSAEVRKAVWQAVKEHAAKRGWTWNQDQVCFEEKAAQAEEIPF